MKCSPFEYVRPRTLDESIEWLQKDPEETKVLAGGQSLVPLMNLRMAQPERLLDINELFELDYLTRYEDRVILGTMTRHVTLEKTQYPGPLGHLFRESARHIGHVPIRVRGTFGGSVAHCDSASEWCLLARLLDAIVIVESVRGQRRVEAADFFQGFFTTSLEQDELIVAIELPHLTAAHSTSVAEFAQQHGDFAIVAAMTDIEVVDGTVLSAAVCLGGVSDVPFRSAAAEGLLTGQTRSSELAQAAAEAAADEVSPGSDDRGDASYRRQLVRVLVAQALESGLNDKEGCRDD